MRLFKISLLLLAFSVVTPVFAQLDTSFIQSNQTSLSTDPEFPKPGELVTVTIESYGSNSFNSNIVWRYDGEIIADATNQRSAQVIAGDLGESNTVNASLVSPTGVQTNVSKVIEPRYIDIVIEPQTRVPDFFAGRALPSIGSSVNATALINNGQSDKSNLVYTWRLNNKVLNGGPIRGSNQISFAMPRGSDAVLTLDISSVSGEVIGRRALIVDSVKPELHFYESNALYGVSHVSITDSLILIGSNTTIVAEPFYLDSRTYNNPDINEWEINTTANTNQGSNPYEVTIQKVESGGSSKVSFHVRSTTELLQGVEDSIVIVF